jgi:hypothetical protein
MSAAVGIVCDGGCGKQDIRMTVVQPAAGPARKRQKANGWRTVRGTYETVRIVRVEADGTRVHATASYTRDICPDCWAAGKR